MIRRASPLALALLLPLGPLAACGDDAAPAPQADSADAASPDVAADVAETDTSPPLSGPWARLYPVSPAEGPADALVELAHLTADDGRLEGEFARVRNCVPDLEGGQKIPVQLGAATLTVTTCRPEATVFPDERGTYLGLAPPATPADDDGRFAELMMYHHMQVVHDYFKGVHGLTERDHPLDALVNVQAHIDLCDQWAKLPNAAFIPEESMSELPFGLDLGVDGDAIVFSGTDAKNFSFDATVIYHEYTHAILGADRLSGVFADAQGLNNLPGALNEAYADYFATTLIDSSTLGAYSLNDLGEFAICGIPLGSGGNQARDLDNAYRCPADLTGEVHADSELFSAVLWEMRAELGAEPADRVILAAVLELTQTSDFTEAALATIDQAGELLGAEVGGYVEEMFRSRGLVDCERVLPVGLIGARGLPVQLYSPEDFGAANPFGDFVPAAMQFSLDVPGGARSLTLTLTFSEGGLGSLLGGGGEVAADVAFKRGAGAILYRAGRGGPIHAADAVIAMDPETRQVTLSGACLEAGPLVFSVHNKGGATALSKVEVSTSLTAAPTSNFDSCER